MRIKKIAIVALIFIISTFLIYHHFTTNEFYEDTSTDFGLCKIPLIEPYGLLSQDCKVNWGYSFDFPIANNHVDSIAVVDSLIIWNNISGTVASGHVGNYHWFIFDTSIKKKNVFFTTKPDLDFYLQGVCKEKIYFYAPQDVWNHYWDNDKIWIMLQCSAKERVDGRWYR